MSNTSVSTDPVGTVRRHYNMPAFKLPDGDWLIVYQDEEYPPVRTAQRIEELNEKWPVTYRPGETTVLSLA